MVWLSADVPFDLQSLDRKLWKEIAALPAHNLKAAKSALEKSLLQRQGLVT